MAGMETWAKMSLVLFVRCIRDKVNASNVECIS